MLLPGEITPLEVVYPSGVCTVMSPPIETEAYTPEPGSIRVGYTENFRMMSPERKLGPRLDHTNLSADPLAVLARCSEFVPVFTGAVASALIAEVDDPYIPVVQRVYESSNTKLFAVMLLIGKLLARLWSVRKRAL